MSLSLVDLVERARGRFRQDVADQLKAAARKAGLAAVVRVDDERAVLEFDEALPGALPRVIAAFENHHDDDSGVDQVVLSVETGEERTMLLTLVWQNDAGLDEQSALQRRLAELEGRTDRGMPLAGRGLNAAADMRTGRYARGDVIGQLAGDLNRAAVQASQVLEQSRALVPIERPAQDLADMPGRGRKS